MSETNGPKFYDWTKTLSFDADITMVCGARGIGKTYGLRLQIVRDYLKHGWRFVEVSRFKNQLGNIGTGYFDRIASNGEFEGVRFKSDGRAAYISLEDNEKGKPVWEQIGYFVALSEHQHIKRMTFDNVRRIILDEFILDRKDVHHRYLQDEFGKLASIVDTVSRERADTDSIKPKLYLLGNALNVVNPYFEALGIRDIPNKGFSWYAGKTVLLHYADNAKYSEEKATKTLAGKMYRISGRAQENVYNDFLVTAKENIETKPKNAGFIYGIVYKGRKFGVWADSSTMRFYVNRRIPNHAEPVFALSSEDKELDFRIARRTEKRLVSLVELFGEGRVFFDTEATRRVCFEIFSLYGLRIA